VYYFKSQKDNEQTGEIKLNDPQTTAALDGVKKGKHHFVINTPGRTWFIYSERDDGTKDWVESINRNMGKNGPGNKNVMPVGSAPPVQSIPVSNPPIEEVKPVTPIVHNNNAPSSPPSGSSTNENKLYAAKDVIPFLKNEEGKVLEFWLIWAESIPTKEEQPGINMDYHIATSANLQKLTWRTSGPQNAFIQKMVDFFLQCWSSRFGN
jgi:hypothetical protein